MSVQADVDPRSFRRRRSSGRTAAPRPRAAPLRPVALGNKTLIVLLLVCLALPFFFFVGPLRLSPYRLLLLVVFVPVAVAWVSGSAGRIRAPDLLMIGYCVWSCFALFANHGLAKWEFAGMFVIETLTPYLLARCLIRGPSEFAFFLKALRILILALIPIVALESVTGFQALNTLFGAGFPVFGDVQLDPRWGLQRAQGPFEHPILFGIFCSTAFALCYYGMRAPGRPLRPLFWAGVSGIATFFSLSMGAFVSVLAQGGLIAWDKLTKPIPMRWLALALGLLGAYIVIDILSHRTPFEVFISYATFNVGNAYNRVLIWHFGTAEVMRHPLFGIGLGEWQRPYWMSSSMDNFWLATAVRYGLPGALLMIASFLVLLTQVGRARHGDPRVRNFRKGFMIAVVGLFVGICTVHLWNATYTYMLFLLGSGMWLANGSRPPVPAARTPEANRNAGAAPGDTPPGDTPPGRTDKARPHRRSRRHA
jgi:hypothetical protein